MQSDGSRPKVLLVKHWMDIHDRGVKVVATRLRDAGFEVVYTVYRLPEEVVTTAIQEDTKVIGMSFSTSAYEVHIPKVMKELKRNKLRDVMVIIGGIIPNEDHKWLRSQGVKGIFGAGSDINGVIELIK